MCGAIGHGLLVLLGIAREDSEADAEYLADKLLGLRIFADSQGKMNQNILESSGELLVVPQFTLLGDCRKGRRPDFSRSAPPDRARELYEYFVDIARRSPLKVETGKFQEHMLVHLVNDGPVTILVDSAERSGKS